MTKAGLLKPEDLREGMLIAKQQSLPVGRVLIMAEFISEPNLQAAVQAQSMLKDGLIDIDTALEALKESAQSQITLDEALNRKGWKDKTSNVSNKLGELLIESEFITKEQLDGGLSQSQMSGFPLGRVLVVMGFMSEQLLSSALNAQILIRDNKIFREQAIQGLKACRERQISIEQSLKDAGLQLLMGGDTIRLGELLVMANLLIQEDLMQAIELGLTESKPIGQVLVENKLLTQEMLEAGLAVQRLVAEGKVKRSQSGDVLALVNKEGLTIEQAIQKLEPPKVAPVQALPLYQFLQLAGLITAKDIEEALKQGSRNTELMGKMLLLTGAIDQNLLSASMRLNDLVTQGVLKPEQAILAMGLCQNRSCSVEQAFKSLGWSMALGQAAVASAETIPPYSPTAETGAHTVARSELASGQYATVSDQTNTGQHAAQSTSGQYGSVQGEQQYVSGRHDAVSESYVETGTATSDVPILDRNMFLGGAQGSAGDANQILQEDDAAKSEQAQNESGSDDGSKKKGGGKKRLADLMP